MGSIIMVAVDLTMVNVLLVLIVVKAISEMAVLTHLMELAPRAKLVAMGSTWLGVVT